MRKALVWFSCLCLWALPASAQTRVVHCGAVLEVHTGQLLRDRAILVEGDKIKSIVPWNSGLPGLVVDWSRYTVLPGLIDVHTHLVDSEETYSVTHPLQVTAAEMAFAGIPNAAATLRAGFTTVRDLGTYRAFIDVALRDAIDKGIVIGPRMQCAGAYITTSQGAGSLAGLAPDIELPLELRYGVADSPDQVRQKVRLILHHGASVIKILATGAVLTPGSVPGSQEMTYAEMLAAVEEAHAAGVKVACHAHGAAGANDAIRAGVASIEHGSYLTRTELAMMKERGTFLCPDLFNNDWMLQHPPAGYPAEYFLKIKQTKARQELTFQWAHTMGVKIAFATDAATIPHGANAQQFKTYVANGMTPLEAIQTATVNAADLLGWTHQVGALDPGCYADMMAVEGDPTQNVELLCHPAGVIKGGVLYAPAGSAPSGAR